MLRKIGKGFLVLVVLLAAWIAINSIDEAPRYDQSLLLPRVEVPDEQNGYALLRNLDKGEGKNALNKEDSQQLRKIIVDWEWNRQFAERVLSEHANSIDLVKQVVAKPRFVTDQTWNVYSGLPSYMRILDLQKLVLLKARLDEEKGNYGDAIEVASLAMQYCEKIRMDEQGYLISYLIGWSCIASVTDFYHELLSNNVLSDNQLALIEEAMSNVADYGKDGFDRVIKRELSETKYISQWYDHHSVMERWDIVRAAIQDKRLCYSCKYSVLDTAYGYFNAVLARYYWHANEVLNSHITSHEKVISYANDKCSSIDSSAFLNGALDDWSESRALIDFLVPGSASKNFFSGTYEDYVVRRCSYYNYYSAVKGIVAMARYRARHDGEYPNFLQQLIPDYLKTLPEDFFGKNGLQYDPASKRLYSVGINHDNSAAPDAGFYKGKCSHISKNPVSKCELSPAFPVNWNDYKFYETLRKAESGDLNSQRHLGWMYQYDPHAPIDIEKAVYWYTKSAEKNDAHAQYLLGSLYEVREHGCSNPGPAAAIQDDRKSFEWYKKSYENGSSYGGNGYAKYLISGKGGVNDFQKAVRILVNDAVSERVDYDGSWLYVLRNIRLLNTNTAALLSVWADYYLQHPDLAKGFGSEKESGVQMMHRLLASNLWWNSDQYSVDSSEERKKLELWAASLREHYLAVHNDDGIKELDKFLADKEKNKVVHEYPKGHPAACQLVFDHRHEDMAQFQAAQQKIFQNKGNAKAVITSFNKVMKRKYHQSMKANGISEENISLGFPAISVQSVLELMVDFLYGDVNYEPELSFDDSIKNIKPMIYSKDEYPPVMANLILADFGIGAQCSEGKVHFFIEDQAKANSHMMTSNFVVDWSKNIIYKDGDLQGVGKLDYENAFSYTGELSRGLPNGKGEYALSHTELFKGDNFINGMLSGAGVMLEDDHLVERGEYKLNVLEKGAIGYGYGGIFYEGEWHDGEFQGSGTVTYFDVGDLKTYHLPLDHNYPPIWSFTGTFQEGQKINGTCKIFKEKVVADTFTCEFYKDALVKIGDVSLLPPGMTTSDLQKYMP